MKCDNVLVRELITHPKFEAVISDFGFSRLKTDDPQPVRGSVPYLSPEMAILLHCGMKPSFKQVIDYDHFATGIIIQCIVSGSSMHLSVQSQDMKGNGKIEVMDQKLRLNSSFKCNNQGVNDIVSNLMHPFPSKRRLIPTMLSNESDRIEMSTLSHGNARAFRLVRR